MSPTYRLARLFFVLGSGCFLAYFAWSRVGSLQDGAIAAVIYFHGVWWAAARPEVREH